MPLLNLPTWWIIALNVLGWPVIHLSIAWMFLQLQPHRVRRLPCFPTLGLELTVYEHLLAIRRWKHLLPDGAAWLGHGAAKSRLNHRDPAWRARLLLECRRGEAAHWAMLLAAPVFCLWNPPWAMAIMVVYGLLANLPCIVTQRYNRIRLTNERR